MIKTPGTVPTLRDVARALGSESDARKYFASKRWPDGAHCPYCNHSRIYRLRDDKTYKCGNCAKRFSITVGTIFENSKLPIQTWVYAIAFLCEKKGRVGSTELAIRLGLSQKSAWYLLERLHDAARTLSFQKPLRSQKNYQKHNHSHEELSIGFKTEPRDLIKKPRKLPMPDAVEEVLQKLNHRRASFGGGHPSDASRFSLLFKPLFAQGFQISAADCYQWAREHGWDDDEASELEKVILTMRVNR